jgi:23S rRNA pseudouridine1911/1915/1917 synthase
MDEISDASEEQDLFEHHRFVVDPGQQPERLDKFVFTRIPQATRTRVQTAIEAGNVRVDGKPSKSSYKVRPGDQITVVLPKPPREYSPRYCF